MSSEFLKDAVVVVTGAGGAAGPAAVSAFQAAGATVVAADSDSALLSQFDDIERVHTKQVDLLDEAATVKWAESLVNDFGRVDGLMHLVGGWRGGQPIVEADLHDWDVLSNSLVRTLFVVTKAFHNALLASPNGRFAIISSTGVDQPKPTNAVYLAAKAASEKWMHAVAESFAKATPEPDTLHTAAVILRVMALLTPQMRADSPDKAFKGYTSVDEVAQAMVGLWDTPAWELNGKTQTLKP